MSAPPVNAGSAIFLRFTMIKQNTIDIGKPAIGEAKHTLDSDKGQSWIESHSHIL
jgi:hypothetical protein